MVEEVQHQHPAIEMCAIIGVPNPERIGDQQELFSGITGTLQFINEPTLAWYPIRKLKTPDLINVAHAPRQPLSLSIPSRFGSWWGP